MDMRRDPLRALQKRIGYRFKNKTLLDAALTHPSFRYENDGVDEDNQRLEFLGDAVLGLLAADQLVRRHEEAGEGELTRRKTGLIAGVALARAARRIELGPCLRLGKGEAAAGGADRDSNLEDALEALLGAVWLDGGLKAARRFFERVVFAATEAEGPLLHNPKGILQEYAQKNGYGVPTYRVVEETGPDHARHYRVEVLLAGYAFCGEGTSRREAEKKAAEKAVTNMIK